MTPKFFSPRTKTTTSYKLLNYSNTLIFSIPNKNSASLLRIFNITCAPQSAREQIRQWFILHTGPYYKPFPYLRMFLRSRAWWKRIDSLTFVLTFIELNWPFFSIEKVMRCDTAPPPEAGACARACCPEQC